MNLAQLLTDAAERRPDAPALASGERVVATYAQHADRSARIAGALRTTLGLGKGDIAALAMKNHPVISEIMFAAWIAGCAVLPMNARLHPRELAWILDNAGAKACFATDEIEIAGGRHAVIAANSKRFDELSRSDPLPPADVDADDLAWLFYTSGTTGKPKGAMLSHRNLRAMNAAYFAGVDEIAPEDCIVHAAPMSHGSGLYLLPHVERGACQVIPESGGFDPGEAMSLLRTWNGATLFLAPTMLTRLMRTPDLDRTALAGLKTIVYGGAPMYVDDLLEALSAFGPRLVQIYGQGEAPMTISCLSRALHADAGHPDYRNRLASVGRAHAGVEVRVTNERGETAAAGELGEVTVRGDVVMRGYFRNPEATSETLRDGWLRTGDVGALDADGFLTLKDRSKDLVISGGSNVYPREVEEVLVGHDGVLECAVVGRPHPDWGEEVVAFVVAKPGVAVRETDLDRLCLERIARFKRPRLYRFVDALPKNNYGKILKTQLREMAAL